MLRYSLKRLLIFVVCMGAAWLAFGRPTTAGGLAWPLLIAALASAILSYPLLKAERERFSEQINRRVEAHMANNADHAKQPKVGAVDADAEDAEDERAR